MQHSSRGFTWNFPTGKQLPLLLSAQEYFLKRWDARTRIVHPVWVLDYTPTRWGRYRVATRSGPWAERSAHVAHLYPPHQSYWTDVYKERLPLRSLCLAILHGEACGFDKLIQQRQRFARFIDPEQRLQGLLEKLAQHAQGLGEAGFWKAQAHFYEIIDLLHASQRTGEGEYRISTETLRPRPEHSQLAANVLAYCREHLADRVTLQKVARHLNVSVSTLSHTFRLEMGRAPMAALLDLRIAAAKTQLLNGYPLKTIAEQTGFCDVYHLSKMFKQREGLSPRAYLKKLK